MTHQNKNPHATSKQTSQHRPSSNHNSHNHHALCNQATSANFSTNNLLMASHQPPGLPASSLPHQLSQLCNSQQYPLLALQHNFSHLLPQGYAAAAAVAAAAAETSQHQQHIGQHDNFQNTNNNHIHFRNHISGGGAGSSSNNNNNTTTNNNNSPGSNYTRNLAGANTSANISTGNSNSTANFIASATSNNSLNISLDAAIKMKQQYQRYNFSNNNNSTIAIANNHHLNHQLNLNPTSSTNQNHHHQLFRNNFPHHHHHHPHLHHHHHHHHHHNGGSSSSSSGGTLVNSGSAPSEANASSSNTASSTNNSTCIVSNSTINNICNGRNNHRQDQLHPTHQQNQQHSHHNWRESKSSLGFPRRLDMTQIGAPHSLLDLSAKVVAEHIPFQSIELRYEHIPEPVQRRIIFWSFPRHEDDIRMYSSLSSETSASSSSSTATNSSNSLTINNQAPPHAWVMPDNRLDNPAVAAAVVQPNTSQNPTSLGKAGHNQRQITFYKGQRLYHEGCVHDVLQVGFNLSGLISIRNSLNNQLASTSSKVRGSSQNNSNSNLNPSVHNNDSLNNPLPASLPDMQGSLPNESSSVRNYRVSVTFDRCKITSVSCSCELQDIFWCEHVVALILFRIRNPETIDLRVPISETLSSLDRQQLQKLVQYIIAEHHTEVLPTAQRLLDEMRQSFSEINQIQGAPDPTAGACAEDDHIWHLDESQVNEKVQNYLNLVSNSSKEASKHINALFEKIREMFRAGDSNGTRLLRLITEQFLTNATRNDKSRPLWDQLVSLWVVVMLNPDLELLEKTELASLLREWSKVPKCPREDVERRVSAKRKAAEISDDEDSDDLTVNLYNSDIAGHYGQSNNYPAHMATHRHRSFISSGQFPVLKPFNNLPSLPAACPCQLPSSIVKKMKNSHQQLNDSSSRGYMMASSSSNQGLQRNSSANNHADARALAPQEPRSVFYRAIDFLDVTWDDSHLQLILKKDGPIHDDNSHKSSLFDYTGNPLWYESLSQTAARVETLRSHGYREQALRLTVASIRKLKLHQDQWCLAASGDSNTEPPCLSKAFDSYNESWIGHPLDPINIFVDLLLDASLNESANAEDIQHDNICTINSTRCSCPYNQALADFTHRLLPDLASLSYHNAPHVDGFPILPLVNLAARRTQTSTSSLGADKTPYYHVPVPACCQKDSYLTMGVEVALIALGQQRSVPTIGTAHDRAIRQESELISKLETIDTSDPMLIEILKHQTSLLLEGGPFQNTCCGILTDSTPLHTFAKYLFESLVPHCPQLAYRIGVHALKTPLLTDDNSENTGAARTSPRTTNYNHLQAEQLILAQTMLSKAKDDAQIKDCLKKVYRASVKNIRNPASLLKLSKHALKEAKPSGATLYPTLLETSFELGLQVLKTTLSPQASNGKTRREAILFIVECATDNGLEAVLQVMKDARHYFSAIEALNLVVARDNDHVNLRSQAQTKLKLKDSIQELDLNRRSRDLVLECAIRDPSNCALEALKFCELDDESLKKALKIVMDAGTAGSMDSTQLIKVADHIHDRGLPDKAFDISLVAVDSLSIPSNSDTSSSKNTIISACEYAKKVNGFSILIPKLINNIECATVLSDIYHRFSPSCQVAPTNFSAYGGHPLASHRNNLKYISRDYDMMSNLAADNYKQRVEDARWWDALLERALKAFIDTTRNRLQNISPRHYGDFIKFLITAQETFQKAADGPEQFRGMVSEIMKSYRTKKKLIEKLKESFEKPVKSKS